MKLTPAERAELDEKLQGFGSFEELRRALHEQCGRNINTWTSPAALPIVSQDLMEAAEAEGWLADLWALRREVRLDSHLTDLANFDLDAIATGFRTARLRSGDAGPLGVAVVTTDHHFFDCVCVRLASIVRAARRLPTTLDERLTSLPREVRRLEDARKAVVARPQLLPVRAHMVLDATRIEDFWKEVCARLVDLPHPFVVVLSVAPGHPTPESIVRLPEPAFEMGVVDTWVGGLATCLDWSQEDRDDVTRAIWTSTEGHTGDVLIYQLYSELRRCIDALLDNPSTPVRQLL